jgi:hypothetical protein
MEASGRNAARRGVLGKHSYAWMTLDRGSLRRAGHAPLAGPAARNAA